MKILLTILMCCTVAYASDIPEDYMLSNSDVNRIVCPETINEVHSSEEKGLQIKVSGKNVYVKFPIIIEEMSGFSHKIKASEPAGIFIDCGEVYNLNLYPTDNPPQTITLKKQYEQELMAKPFEDVLTEIIRILVQNKYPAGITPTPAKEAYIIKKEEQDISVVLRNIINIYGMTVLELYAHSNSEINLTETDLLGLPWVEFPFAVAISDPLFSGWTRAFIIQQGSN